MNRAALFLSSVIIALMAMPPSVNLLGFIGGDLSVNLLPIALMGGLVVGGAVAMQKSGTARSLLQYTNKYLLAFLCLATLSMIWSAFPLTTLYRLFRLYAQVLTCLLFCLAGWKPGRFAKAVLPAILFINVASIIYFLIDRDGALQPSVIDGIVYPELVGAWRGVTLHKNTLGAMAAMGTIFSVSELLSGRKSRLLSLAVLGTSLICLVGAKSSTSMFTAAFGIALMLLILKAPAIKKRRTVRALTFTLVAFFLVYSLGILNIVPGLGALIEPVVALTGKDMTFSGRTIIWAIMNDQIRQHPILGIGYASFWLGPNAPSPAAVFPLRMFVYPGEAHNGYLDVMNELGVVGIFALIAYLFEYLRQSVRLLLFDRQKASLYIALLFAQTIANMSEAHWWSIASVQFFILTLATFDIASALRQKRLQERQMAAQVPREQVMPARRAPGSGRAGFSR